MFVFLGPYTAASASPASRVHSLPADEGAQAAFARTYRDKKHIALQSAQFLKSRNPNSVVKMKDLRTGEETILGFKPGQ